MAAKTERHWLTMVGGFLAVVKHCHPVTFRYQAQVRH